MKSIIQKLWMFIVMLCASISASAYDFEVDGICYDITSFTDLTVSASSLSQDVKPSLIIPESVEFNGKTLRVTTVGKNFAINNNTIQSVYISSGVSIIEQNAFSSCSQLTNVEIESAKEIYEYAFYGCSLLNSIVLNNPIETIGKECFAECQELKEIVLPNNLEEISYGLFRNCVNLAKIEIPSKVTIIESSAFCGCSSIKEIVIPDNVLAIGSGTFENCTSLMACTIGSGVNSIEKNLFGGCPKLETIVFKSSPAPIKLNDYTQISYTQDLNKHKYFYKYQSDLSQVPFKNVILEREIVEEKDRITSHYYSGDGVTVYNYYSYLPLFANHQYLQNLTISYNIPKNEFKGCKDLKNVILQNGVVSIGDNAFADCINLSSCKFGETIFEIGENAFINCNNLLDFTLPDALRYLSTSCFNNCVSLQQVSIPNNVTTLGEGAFRGCSNLKSIVLGTHLLEIKSSCFKDCKSLTSLSLLAKIPPKATECFDNEHYYKTSVNIPVSTRTDYVDSPIWNNFWNISENDDIYIGDFETDNIIYQIETDNSVIVRSSSKGYSGDIIIPSHVSNNNKEYSVVSIGQAFKGSQNLVSIQLPSTISYIVGGAFANCSNLDQLNIPASIDCIGDTAFIGCTSLSSLIIEESDKPLIMGKGKFNKKVKIGGWTANYYPKSGEYFVLYYDGLFKECPIKEITIGRSLSYPHFEKYDINELGETYTDGSAYMGRYCVKYDSPFYGINYLKRALIGSNVSVLGVPEFTISDWKENLLVSPDLFKGCDNLEIIESYSAIAPTGSGFNDETYSTAFLFLPNGGIESYQNDESWKRFLHISESSFVPIASIAFASEEITLDFNETKTLYPIINPDDASIKSLKWSSSAPNIVNVSYEGLITSFTENGEATIAVSTCDGSELSASIKVFVQKNSGISDILEDNPIFVNVENGYIRVLNKEATTIVRVYTIQGTMIAETTEDEVHNLSDGIYIVTVGTEPFKVFVR